MTFSLLLFELGRVEKKPPLLRRGLPSSQVVNKERNDIHQFGLSREGCVFENVVE